MRISIIVATLALGALTTAADPARTPPYSVWTGTYVCGQGVTNVRLTIETRPEGNAAFGHFEFSAHESNKLVPSGDYWLKGTMRANPHGHLEVKLAPDRWGVRPPNYVMVGLTATSDREQRALDGKIDFPNCSTISVKRVVAEHP